MRIDGPKTDPISERPVGERAADSTIAEKKDAGSPASTVSIGPAAAEASRVAERFDQEVQSRLERVRALLVAGHYPHDLDALAERIVNEELRNAPRSPGR